MAGRRFLILGLAVLGLLTSFQRAHAQTYEPGRGILLKKKDHGDLGTPEQKIQEQNTSNSDITVIDRGKIVQGGGATTPTIVNPSKAPSGNAQTMTNAYASHMYSSICAQNYRESLAPKTEEGLNMQKMWADVQASCKCMSNQILSVVPATDLADYVMYNYSAQQPGTNATEKENYYASARSNQIDALVINDQLRKKCGFIN